MITAQNSPCMPLPLEKLQNKQEITKIHSRHYPGISPLITVIIWLSEIHKNIHFIKNSVRLWLQLQPSTHSKTNLDSVPDLPGGFFFCIFCKIDCPPVTVQNMHTRNGDSGWYLIEIYSIIWIYLLGLILLLIISQHCLWVWISGEVENLVIPVSHQNLHLKVGFFPTHLKYYGVMTVARHSSNAILLFVDDATIQGLNTDETTYREEVHSLKAKCQDKTSHSMSAKPRKWSFTSRNVRKELIIPPF